MKITHIVPYRLDPYSGVYTSIVGLTRGLARAGHSVAVWNLSPWPQDRPDLLAALDEAGVVRRELPESPRPWMLSSETKRIVDAELAPGVVHLHSAFSPQNNLLARRIDRPMVLSPHGVLLPGSLGKSPLRKQIYRRLIELPTLRKMAAVCALTEDEASEIRAFGYGGRTVVLPNGAPAASPGVDRETLRRELGIPAAARVGLYVGRIQIAHKRLDHLVRAVSDSPGWHFVVVGSDYRGDAAVLEATLADLPGRDRIHFVGPKRGEELARAFAGADAFLLLSHSEGMSMALLEALAYGLPALVSLEVEQALPVEGSGAGWAVEPTQLAAALGRLAAADTGQWAEKQTGAVRLAATYSWDAIAARFATLYESISGAV